MQNFLLSGAELFLTVTVIYYAYPTELGECMTDRRRITDRNR